MENSKKSGDNISVITTFCDSSNRVNFQFYCRPTLFGIEPQKCYKAKNKSPETPLN
jgi:hypothetical protein